MPQPSIWQLFLVSLRIFAVNFPIIYPVFLYYTVFSMLIPSQMPDYTQWQWWVISLGGVCMVYLFKAGWNAMMNQAVVENLPEKPPTPEAQATHRGRLFYDVPAKDWFASFGIIKPFVGGIGEKGLSYLLVGVSESLLLILPGLALGLLAYYQIGFPEEVVKGFMGLLNNPSATTTDVMTFLEKLPDAVINQLNLWSLVLLVAVLISAALQWFLLYWEALLYNKPKFALGALWQSITLCFKFPLKTFVMGMLYYSSMVFVFSFSLFGEIGSFIMSFLMMAHTVIMGTLFFLFIYTYLPEQKALALSEYKARNVKPSNPDDQFAKKI